MDVTPQPIPTTPSRLGPSAWQALRRQWAIVLIVVLFVALGLVYNVKTPIFEAPDETYHYLYVQWLADGRGLPPLRLADTDVEQGEMHHPPLYYVLGALSISGVERGDQVPYTVNPYANLGQPKVPGNKNAVLHLEGEGWPYGGVPLAVHILRLLSTVLSAGTVVLTYLTARTALPNRPLVALGAASLLAFNPQFLFISAAVSNDALAALLGSAALYLAVRIACGWGDRLATPALLGAIVGLGMLSKVSLMAGLALIPLAYAANAWRLRSQEADGEPATFWARIAQPSLIGIAAALAVGGWWYMRNAIQYGDPLSMGTMRAVFGVYEQPLSMWRTVTLMAESLISYWGVFGWMNVLADEAYYVLVRLLTGLSVVGLALGLTWALWMRKNLARLPWHTLGLPAIWFLINLASYAQFARTITGPQGRLLFPAAGSIALFLSLGLSSLVPRRARAALAGGLAGLFLCAAALAPWRTIAPAYAMPARVTLEEAPLTMRDLGIRFSEDVFLLGYQMDQSSVLTGDALRVRLYWLAVGAMDEDLTVSLRVYGRDDAVIGQLDTFPGMGSYPTRLWTPGEVLYDDYVIPISGEAEAPTAASLRVGLYRREGMVHLSALDAAGTDVGTGPQIARVRVAPARRTEPQPAQDLDLRFGESVALEGYGVTHSTDGASQTLDVRLYWRRVGPLAQDWTVFVHLLDEVGNLVAQDDQQPVRGNYPTSYWDMDERVMDGHSLALPAGLAPGRYFLNVGLYLLGSEERLPVSGEESRGNYALVGPITIEGLSP